MAGDHLILLVNEEDWDAGFFHFGTSDLKTFKRLCRRIGGEEKLLGVELQQQRGKVTWWQCRVPREFFGMRTFRLGKSRPGNPTAGFKRKTEGRVETENG